MIVERQTFLYSILHETTTNIFGSMILLAWCYIRLTPSSCRLMFRNNMIVKQYRYVMLFTISKCICICGWTIKLRSNLTITFGLLVDIKLQWNLCDPTPEFSDILWLPTRISGP
jgi:hypothetical protein